MSAPRRLQPLFLLVLASLLGLLGFVATGLSLHHYPARLAPAADIARNPWAAAERFLAQAPSPLTVKRVHSAAALSPLPDTHTVMIVDSHRAQLTDSLVQRLHHWVAQGGHLIVAARRPHRPFSLDSLTPTQGYQNDPLLFPLGVVPLPTDWHWPETPPELGTALPLSLEVERLLSDALVEDEQFKRWSEWRWCRTQTITDYAHLTFDDVAGSRRHRLRRAMLDLDIQLTLQPLPALQDANRSTLPFTPPAPVALAQAFGSRYGHSLLQLQLGAGQVTVLTDIHIWSNDQLHLLDHAWLLERLTEQARQVWFVHSVAMPALPVLIWQQAWPVCLSALVLLVLLLWHYGKRIGPVLDDPHHTTPQHYDSLEAEGRFLWRSHQQVYLLSSLRQRSWQALALPGEPHTALPPSRLQAIMHALAQALGHPVTQIEAALTGAVATDHAAFTEQVRTLQLIIQHSTGTHHE